jgi:hypothetical protein
MEIERLRLQFEITNAQLLYKVTPAKMNISIEHGQMDIDHEPLKLTIEDQSFSDSTQISADTPQSDEQAQRAKAALDAAGRYSREKSAAASPAGTDATVMTVAETSGGTDKPKLTWTGGKVTIKAERDQVSVDWQPQKIDFTYIPYSVEYYIDKW